MLQCCLGGKRSTVRPRTLFVDRLRLMHGIGLIARCGYMIWYSGSHFINYKRTLKVYDLFMRMFNSRCHLESSFSGIITGMETGHYRLSLTTCFWSLQVNNDGNCNIFAQFAYRCISLLHIYGRGEYRIASLLTYRRLTYSLKSCAAAYSCQMCNQKTVREC
jgi:hypothetical protein